jgi:hypothetical protein
MPLVRRRTPPSFPRGLALDIAQFSGNLTLTTSHIDGVLQCTDGSGVTVTLPRDLPVGYYALIEQGGAGQVTFAAATGATLVNRQTHTKTAGQYAVVSVFVRANIGGRSAEWALNGDTGA